VLRELRADTGIEYDGREGGTLQLFRTPKQLDHMVDDTAVLDEGGVPYQLLDPVGCVSVEPAAARTRDRFVGGLHLPGDGTGDAHLFTQHLAAIAAGLGVQVQHGTAIRGLRTEGGNVADVETGAGVLMADRYVVTRPHCCARWG
jgi:D-amino-acid dehydrogenase